MFSGGEKKSFYELSYVIGIGIIALKLKINRFNCLQSNLNFANPCFSVR